MLFRSVQEAKKALQKFTIDTSGNVGIGTDGPAVPLEIAGETRIYPSSGTGILRFGSGGAEKGRLSVDSSSNMVLETAGSTALTLDSSQNATLAGTLGVTSTIRVTTDGSASAPCYQVGGDADTGMYQPATNQLGFTVAGTQKLYFTTVAMNLDSSLTSGLNMGDDIPVKWETLVIYRFTMMVLVVI